MQLKTPAGLTVMLTSIYGPPVLADRYKLWQFIEETSLQTQRPWLLIGDFNQVASIKEKFSKNFKAEGADWFQLALFQAELIEARSFGNWFTWTNNRSKEDLVMERLDKAYFNEEWLS